MLTNSSLQTDVALQSMNTFGIAAQARYFVQINHADQLRSLAQSPEFKDLPRLVLGGGSNIVLTRDFPGVVLKMAIPGVAVVAEDDQTTYVQAGAGENWHEFVQWTLAQGLGGLENLSLIPGSVGAAPIQNIGAYGVELKDYFHSLSWYEFETGTVHNKSLLDCGFAYRDSVFKGALRDRGVILDVTFALPKKWQPVLGYGDVARAVQQFDNPTPSQIGAAICAIRQSKLPDPKQIGNAGSFFKNPLVDASLRDALVIKNPGLVSYAQPDGSYKLAAGWLIEHAGWKGRRVGQVGVYHKQALVLVNLGHATGQEIVNLAALILDDVYSKFGVKLEVEPVFVG